VVHPSQESLLVNWIRVFAAGVFSIFAIGLAGFVWIWWAPCALGGCAPVEELAEFHAEGSEILDRNGVPFARLATVDRRIVSLDSLPAYIPRAFIAIEDQRFYRHGGMDLWRTAGALFNNLKSGRMGEGGSTITQQLARNLFPDWLPYTERNLRRKVLEARAARQIERTFTKDKILELYLNHIYLGNGAYGIEAASRTYFGKSAAEISLAEAATLAALPKAPSVINPKAGLDRAIERRNLVLSRMVEAGYLDETAADAARSAPLRVVDTEPDDRWMEGSYFVEHVRRELEERVGHRFYTAGLRIRTAFDPAIQTAAEEELERQIVAIESGEFGEYHHHTYAESVTAGTVEYLQGALVVLDARNGEVLALVGGRDFHGSRFNRATQAQRQAGSAFKPFVYAAALDRYRSPLHAVEDRPLRVTMPDGEVWEPRNFSGQYEGTITLRDALVRSKNVATVRLALDVGVVNAIEVAHALGISTPIPALPSVALGAAEVRPIEVTGAYAAFANGGRRVEPHLIREIVDRDGRVVWRARDHSERALDPAIAFVLTSVLQDAIDRGTGAAVRAAGFRGPAAGKTGTTNEEADVWFVGYTPELVAGVWMGLDQPATIVDGASGGTLAAPVWGRLMSRIHASRPPPEPWHAPRGVVVAQVDRRTGFVVNEECPGHGPSYTEYFARAVPPRPHCPPLEVAAPATRTDWVDEERRGFIFDSATVHYDSTRARIDWVELEAMRQRSRRVTEENRRRREEMIRGREQPILPEVAPGHAAELPVVPLPAEPAGGSAPPHSGDALGVVPGGLGAAGNPAGQPDTLSTDPRTINPGEVPDEARPGSPASDPVRDTTPRPLPRLLGVPTSGVG